MEWDTEVLRLIFSFSNRLTYNFATLFCMYSGACTMYLHLLEYTNIKKKWEWDSNGQGY